MEASQSTPLSPCLEDLPRDLLPSILKQLPLEIKIKAEASCKMFRGILRDPSEGSSVWETVCLDDPVFEAASPAALAGWAPFNAMLCRFQVIFPSSSRHSTFQHAFFKSAKVHCQLWQAE